MKLKIKKLSENAVIPTKAHSTDAGYDLTAIGVEIVDQGKFGYIEYSFGLAFEIQEGYAGFIFPRSSISKTGLLLANAVGVIDSSYRGPVTARFKHIPGTKRYEIGDRVAQLVILKLEDVEIEITDTLSDSDRGTGGYGSSGS